MFEVITINPQKIFPKFGTKQIIIFVIGSFTILCIYYIEYLVRLNISPWIMIASVAIIIVWNMFNAFNGSLNMTLENIDECIHSDVHNESRINY